MQKRPAIDLSPHEYRRILATARDGTQVPISIIRRKGAIVAAPCLVRAYGAHLWPSQPVFDARGIAFDGGHDMNNLQKAKSGEEYADESAFMQGVVRSCPIAG